MQQLLHSILENTVQHDLDSEGDDEDIHADMLDFDIINSEIQEDLALALSEASAVTYELLMSRIAQSQWFLNLTQHIHVLFPLNDVPKSSQITLILLLLLPSKMVLTKSASDTWDV